MSFLVFISKSGFAFRAIVISLPFITQSKFCHVFSCKLRCLWIARNGSELTFVVDPCFVYHAEIRSRRHWPGWMIGSGQTQVSFNCSLHRGRVRGRINTQLWTPEKHLPKSIISIFGRLGEQ